MRLIQKSGLKEQLVPVIEKMAKDTESLEKNGIIGILTFVEVFSTEGCEKLIYDWLSGPWEMKSKDIADLDLNDFMDTLNEFAEENDFRNFFTQFSQLISAKH